MLKAEVDILTKCDHPNMCASPHMIFSSQTSAHPSGDNLESAYSVKMHKCYETEKILYLVLELLTGGELFDCIIAKGHYSEAEAVRRK